VNIRVVSPAHRAAHSRSDPPTLRIVGETKFVSNGVVGGILAACFTDASVAGTAKVTLVSVN
jgi:hypothetical protein